MFDDQFLSCTHLAGLFISLMLGIIQKRNQCKVPFNLQYNVPQKSNFKFQETTPSPPPQKKDNLRIIYGWVGARKSNLNIFLRLQFNLILEIDKYFPFFIITHQ